jgi:hypothetical protein
MRIAVLTCDKYDWLIPYFWHFFTKNFSDNPYPVDFVTETKKIYFGDTVYYGGIKPWSTILCNYLNQIKDDKVLIILDDYMIYNVLPERIRVAEKLCENEVGCINLYPHYDKFMLPEELEGGFKEYSFSNTHTVGVQITIWQKQYMLDVYKPGFDAWKSEHLGYENMKMLGKKVLFSKDWIFEYAPGGCMKKGIHQEIVWEEMVKKW